MEEQEDEPAGHITFSHQEEKKRFSTQLSLRKFINVARQLTDKQRKLVRSIGFGHILDLSCDAIPRGVLEWLVQRFNVSSRSLQLKDGFIFTVTPFCIHQVLGIPLGGKSVERRCDGAIRIIIAEQTKCKGSYPTIDELINTITPQLDDDMFKRIFMLFALTTFLCPSSHKAASPDYYSALAVVDDIGNFDWCTAVLDKLVYFIHRFQSGESSVIGGCLLPLIIIYFELLDTDLLMNTCTVPRLCLWTSEIVKKYERMDATADGGLYYGRLPMKNISETPFKRNNQDDASILPPIPEQLLHLILSFAPEENHAWVTKEVNRIMRNMYKDALAAMQPAITKHFTSMLELLLPSTNNALIREFNHSRPKLVQNPKLNSTMRVGNTCQTQNRESVSEHSTILQETKEKKPILEAISVVPVIPEKKVYTEKEKEDFIDSFVKSLPQVSEELLDKECPKMAPLNDLLQTLEYMPISHQSNIPYSAELLEHIMHPQKIERTCNTQTSGGTFDLLAYASEFLGGEKRLLTARTIGVGITKELDELQCHRRNEFEICSPTQSLRDIKNTKVDLNHKKRATCMSLNELGTSYIALKKRAKMFVTDSGNQSMPIKELTPLPFTEVGRNLLDDFNWDDPDEVAQIVHSSDKLTETFCSQKCLSGYNTPIKQPIDVPRLPPQKLCCNHFSTPVEKDVYNDIINRIPGHGMRSPRIIKMGSSWADRRTFGSNMKVYGRINKHIMNIMGKAVMVELIEKSKSGLLHDGYWSKYYMKCETAALFQASFENPADIYIHLTKKLTDYRLDKIDMIFLPLSTYGFWYLIVANFRSKAFEILCPNSRLELITEEAKSVIWTFQRSFNIAYPRSNRVNIFDMEAVFRSVSCSTKEADSGVYVMKLLQSHDGETTITFNPDDAKAVREALTYYIVAHPYNENLMQETKDILARYNIVYNQQSATYLAK